MATLQFIPDETDSSVIVVKTTGSEHVYNVGNSYLPNASSSSQHDICNGDEGKVVVLNILASDKNTKEFATSVSENDIIITSIPNYKDTYSLPSNKKNVNGRLAREVFTCNQPGCGKLLVGYDKLRSHAIDHADNQNFQCIVDSCKWSFPTAYKLARHLEKHRGLKDVPCDFEGCNKKFSTVSNMRQHKRLHKATTEIPCLFCDKKFTTHRQMEIHLKCHKDINCLYKCTKEGCSMEFHSKQALAIHTRKHERAPSLTCPFENCGAAFPMLSQLKCHIRKHTGERPYSCTFQGCTWAFRTASKLSRHMKKHTGEKNHVCTYEGCTQRFTRAEHLKEHITMHQKLKNFSCTYPGCTAKYTARSSLYMHMKKHKRVENAQKIQLLCLICNGAYTEKCAAEKHISVDLSSESKTSQETVLTETSENIVKVAAEQPKKILRAKSPKLAKSTTSDQFGYFSLLSQDDTQQMESLESGQSNASATTSEYQAAINSITENAESSTTENFCVSLLTGQTTVQQSPTKSVVNGHSTFEVNNEILASSSARTSFLNVDVNSTASPELEPTVASRVIRQENYSGSARTDYCCSRAHMQKSPLKLQDVAFSDTDESNSRKKSSSANKIGSGAVSSVSDLTLAPTDVVLTSGAITFRDPTTGAHFVQTQLLQDDPPCIVTDMNSQNQVSSNGITSQLSLPSDITVIPVSLLSDSSNPEDTIEFTTSTIGLQEIV